jgi:7-dehydrocholesterol reductase
MDTKRKRVSDSSSKIVQDQNNNNVKPAGYHEAVVYRRYGFNRFVGEVIVPLSLLSAIPILTLTIWYICAKCNGNLFEFYNIIRKFPSIYAVFYEIVLQRFYLTKFAFLTVGSFFVWAILMTILLPGENSNGSVTINGNVPTYKNNGLLYHFVTTIAFFMIATYLEIYTPYSVAVIYDRYDEILVACNVIGFFFCWFLYFKGIFFPSSTDCSTTGNVIFDYYWGTELHPRIFGVDVKLITNCRFGMAVWHLVGIIFVWKCFKVNGFVDSIFVSSALTTIYLTKFFHWESGYTKTIDIALDRAGFYICYGCICWVPGMLLF